MTQLRQKQNGCCVDKQAFEAWLLLNGFKKVDFNFLTVTRKNDGYNTYVRVNPLAVDSSEKFILVLLFIKEDKVYVSRRISDAVFTRHASNQFSYDEAKEQITYILENG